MLRKVLWNILHTIVLTGLFCASLLNVWQNTKTYVHDNRVTLVTWERVNDSYPFLQGQRLKVTLRYGMNTVFEEFWTNDSFVFDIPSNENTIKDLEKFERHFNEMNSSLPLEMRYRVSQTLGEIVSMDTFLQPHFISVPLMDTKKAESTVEFEKYALLQNLLQNPDYLLKLENATWRYLRPTLLISDVEYKPPFKLFTMDSLQPLYAIVSVHLPDILDPKISVTPYLWFFNALQDNSALPVYGTVDGSLYLEIHPFKSDMIKISKTEQVVINLVITNIGILNRTETTDCMDIPFSGLMHLVDDQETEHCETVRYIETMVQTCQCIPFTFRRQIAMVNQHHLPFCTPEIYSNCSKRIDTAVARSRKCRPPCTQVKNQYSVIISKAPLETVWQQFLGLTDAGLMVFSKPQAVMNLRCNDAVYGVYTEKVQVTLQQYISQIGGDIGLYLGFSVLGIWQFVVFLCRSYKQSASKNDGSKQTCLQVIKHIWTVVSGDQSMTDRQSNDERVNDNSISEVRLDIEAQMKLMSVRIAEEFEANITSAVALAVKKEARKIRGISGNDAGGIKC